MQYFYAFIVGGIICTIGQLLIDKTKLTPARIMVIFVVSGVGLTAVGAYDYLVKFADAGATVPIVGFGYSLAKGVETAIKEQGALGIITGGLRATAGGIGAAVFFGYVFSLISNSRMK